MTAKEYRARIRGYSLSSLIRIRKNYTKAIRSARAKGIPISPTLRASYNMYCLEIQRQKMAAIRERRRNEHSNS